jgi:uncharacterized damage-inducible protein DinB
MKTLLVTALLLSASLAVADEPNPLSATLKGTYDRIGKLLVAAADEMPATDYAWRPTPEVRSFGQIIGHVADAQYMFCASAKHEKLAPKNNEKTVTGRDALKKALADAVVYCEAVYAATTDASLKDPVELPWMKTNKLGALHVNVSHDNEHYGNLVTYLRMKKLVPPSSKE